MDSSILCWQYHLGLVTKGAMLLSTSIPCVLVISSRHLTSPLAFAINIAALFLQFPVFYFAIYTSCSIVSLRTSYILLERSFFF